MRKLARHVLANSVVGAFVATILNRGTSPSATWEIRAYESWQVCDFADEEW